MANLALALARRLASILEMIDVEFVVSRAVVTCVDTKICFIKTYDIHGPVHL